MNVVAPAAIGSNYRTPDSAFESRGNRHGFTCAVVKHWRDDTTQRPVFVQEIQFQSALSAEKKN
jgi:hypothetical protein